MTQIATFDVSNLAARREAAAPTARNKASADFGQAFERAEHHHEARPPRDDARVEARQSRHQADRAEKPEQPKDQVEAPKADDDQAPKAQADASPTDDAPKAKDADKQADDAQAASQDQNATQAQDPQAQAQVQAQDNPQDTLALLLATAGQVSVAQPTQPTAQAAQPAQEATAVAAVDGQAQAQAQQAVQQQVQADVQAQAQATQAQQQAPQAQAQAQQQAQAQPQAQQQQAEIQPQVPDLLAQAAGSLGPIKVTVTKAEQPTNLAIQAIADQQQQTTTDGPIAQVTVLDGAKGTETASQLVDLLPQLDADRPDDAPTQDTQTLNAPAPQINPEPKAEQAKVADKADAPAAPHEVIKQILDRADQIKGAQQNAVKLQLYPEHLGKMEIRVMSHQGVISAQLTADTPQAKSMLDGQLASLQRSFAEMGLKVDKVEVTLSSSNLDFNGGNAGFAGFDQQPQQQQQNPQPRMQQGAGLGYEQWIPEAVQDDGSYVVTGAEAGINYVA